MRPSVYILASNRNGTLYVSVSPLGDVWRIPPGSTQPQPFGHVNGITPGTDFGLLGLAVDRYGNVYGAVQSANPSANGVWRFDRWTGDATRLPGTSGMGIANGLAFDKQRNLYGKKYLGIERTTFVIDRTGRIAQIYPKVKVEGHVKDVLQFVGED